MLTPLTEKLFKNKTILILVTISIILAVVFFRIIQEPAELPVGQEPLPTPQANIIYKQPVPLKMNASEEEFDLPKILPVHEVENTPYTDSQIKSIAQNLGFTEPPVINEDPFFGKTYLYYAETSRLRLIPATKIIDLKTGDFPEQEFAQLPSDEEVASIALNYLLQRNLISSKEELELYKTRVFSIDELGHIIHSDRPNAIIATFVKKIEDYPILSATFETGIASISINGNKEVYSLYYDEIPEIKESINYRAKTYSEVIQELQTSTTLQSLNEGRIELMRLTPGSVQRADIDTVEIAYIQELNSEQEFLQPVYLLTGTAFLSDRGKVSSVFIMPAVSQNP